MKSFNIGDTVILKSGGPAMTVYLVEANQVYAQWFDSSGAVKKETYHPGVLDQAVKTRRNNRTVDLSR